MWRRKTENRNFSVWASSCQPVSAISLRSIPPLLIPSTALLTHQIPQTERKPEIQEDLSNLKKKAS
jgi:hypothetical protein